MIGVVEALVEVLINSSSECFQGWTVDQVGGWGGGGSFHSLAVLGNKCLCASILEYGMECVILSYRIGDEMCYFYT